MPARVRLRLYVDVCVRRELQPGHVITIEPGLYIPDTPEYGPLRGIGVRIEDDVLVTPTGCEVRCSVKLPCIGEIIWVADMRVGRSWDGYTCLSSFGPLSLRMLGKVG